MTVDGTSSDYTGSQIIIKIPTGKIYNITFKELDDYVTPDPISHTSVGGMTRQEKIIYNFIMPNVMILGLDGKLYTKSQWNNSISVDGIVVKNDSHSFLFSTAGAASGIGYMFLGSNPVTSDATANFISHDSSSKALLDYNGENNTSLIEYYLVNSTNADKVEYNTRWSGTLNFIQNQRFPSGIKAYIGSAGEWQMIIDNMDEIDEILSLIGLDNISDSMNGIIWTSTMWKDESNWKSYRYEINRFYAGNCYGMGIFFPFGKYKI